MNIKIFTAVGARRDDEIKRRCIAREPHDLRAQGPPNRYEYRILAQANHMTVRRPRVIGFAGVRAAAFFNNQHVARAELCERAE